MTYSLTLERTSWKSRYLVYREGDRLLKIYLEMSGVPRFDWVGSDTSFRKWTSPAGEPIAPEKQAEISDRVTDWALGERLSLDFGPPFDMEAHAAGLERKGWGVSRRPDGTIAVLTPPVRRGLLRRVIDILRRKGDHG